MNHSIIFRRTRQFTAYLALALAGGNVCMVPVFAEEQTAAATEVRYAPAKEGKTVYVNISGLASRSRHAKKMTEYHQKQALEGWTVIGVEALVENGDLEGFYVTYTRERLVE